MLKTARQKHLWFGFAMTFIGDSIKRRNLGYRSDFDSAFATLLLSPWHDIIQAEPLLTPMSGRF